MAWRDAQYASHAADVKRPPFWMLSQVLPFRSRPDVDARRSFKGSDPLEPLLLTTAWPLPGTLR